MQLNLDNKEELHSDKPLNDGTKIVVDNIVYIVISCRAMLPYFGEPTGYLLTIVKG